MNTLGNSTEFQYDKVGNIWKIEYPDNTSETFQYDGSGNLVEHTDGKGGTTYFGYDCNDRLGEVRNPDGSSVKYEYYDGGNVKSRGDHFPDRADVLTLYNYDSDDRLIEVHCIDDDGNTLYRHRFAYDITNLMTEFSDVFGQDYGGGLKYGESNVIGKTQGDKYDFTHKFGQLKYGGGDLGFKYGELPLGEPDQIPPDAGGDVPGRIKYGMGEKTSSFRYDNFSRLEEYTDFFGNKFHYGYDKYGRLALVKYPNNVATTYQYDDEGRLYCISHNRMEGGYLEWFTYNYDDNGNITHIVRSDMSIIEYQYDDWNRLTKEDWQKKVGQTYQSFFSIEYSYDTEGGDKYGDTGNICSKTVTREGQSPETTTYQYDSYNKLTSITHPNSSTETLNYDNNGQLTSRVKSNGETTTYQWNDGGRLVKVILPSGEPVEYFYDGLGRLVGRKDSEGEETFIQSGWDVVAKIDGNGESTYYTGLSSIIDEDRQAYFLHNHIGNTNIVTDSDGNITNEIEYEAYGRAVDSSQNPIPDINLENITGSRDLPNLFVGGYGVIYDPKTDLHYMRFRWYSGEMMRFVSKDVFFDNNRYTYAGDNPVKFIDPAGLEYYTPESESILHNWQENLDYRPSYLPELYGPKWTLNKLSKEKIRLHYAKPVDPAWGFVPIGELIEYSYLYGGDLAGTFVVGSLGVATLAMAVASASIAIQGYMMTSKLILRDTGAWARIYMLYERFKWGFRYDAPGGGNPSATHHVCWHYHYWQPWYKWEIDLPFVPRLDYYIINFRLHELNYLINKIWNKLFSYYPKGTLLAKGDSCVPEYLA